MNTNPTVSRFVDRATHTVQPNTLVKADEEGDSYIFTNISRGHHACASGATTHIIIEVDGKIGCSCGDMTYRCHGTNVCKHITQFLKLGVPPQLPAPGELIQKLMIMGWVGGKDDLRPGEPLNPAQDVPSGLASVACPHCKTRAKRKTQEEADAWLDNHMPKCPKNPDNEGAPQKKPSKPAPSQKTRPPIEAVAPDVATPSAPEIYPDEGSWKPDEGPVCEPPGQEVPANLATALCNMQKVDLLAATDSTNTFHNNAKYADLASVWSAIRKPLTDNGLAVIQTTEQYTDGVTVVTTLVHISGETFTSRLSCEVPKSKPDKNGQIKPNIQGLGSTITYLRRYSLAAMVGVAPIDDDGEAAMSR